MLLFLDTHLVQNIIVLRDPEFMKKMHHPKIFTNISTFQFTGKIKGHEPANHITGE
jgi:hypothetical protein